MRRKSKTVLQQGDQLIFNGLHGSEQGQDDPIITVKDLTVEGLVVITVHYAHQDEELRSKVPLERVELLLEQDVWQFLEEVDL